MGFFATVKGLFSRSLDSTKEDQVNAFQNVSISVGTPSVDTSTIASTTTTPVFTSSTSNFIAICLTVCKSCIGVS